ncbi:L,D-transpeptidase family protein [Methylophaga sp. OBS1]|uniref:L,D-transpeptidase family protein n=1 Tax=Methylophaga sp. OBS1 TaxID=2991933 RepID=UPI00225AA04A|nr:L,D-transpeptidase family protein [Methylophaga sp. OBS1]MCX4193269.1 L,D-transpeptidase family protein [Methylophaga sp. OBS1]
MTARNGLVLIVLVIAISSPLQAYSLPENLPVPDHPQLAIFTDNHQPIWLNELQLSQQGRQALHFLSTVAQHGLEPEDYHLDLLQQLSSPDNAEYARYFDLLLTDALLDLIHDLAIGRLDPTQADPQWHIQRDDIDPAAILQNALLSPHLGDTLNQLLPKSSQYHQMTEALSEYRHYVARGGWETLPENMPRLLKPGTEHEAVPALRRRLSTEDFYHPRPSLEDATHYDETLVQAIKQFQRKHGLKQDGIVGPNTLAVLNLSAQAMVDKIRINLERYRWLPDNLGERYLLVNLGSYQLTAVENNDIKLSMKVIVGKETRSTPSFSSAMSHIVINPYWNVPHKLARRDLLPKQKKDPDYFFLNAFNIFLRGTGFESPVDPYLVNWDEVTADNFPFRLQQRPGEQNALGRLKFMFPNPWSIYLHDTPDKALFEETQRNFSSGCIRIEQPLALAEFSLNRDNARESVVNKIESGRNLGEKLEQPLPVYAVYFTVWPYQGEVFFSTDPYKRDQRMLKFL